MCLVLEGPGAKPGLVTDGLDLGIGLLTRQVTAGPWGPCSDEVSQQLLWLILWKSTFCVRNVLKRKTEGTSFLPPSLFPPTLLGNRCASWDDSQQQTEAPTGVSTVQGLESPAGGELCVHHDSDAVA